MATITHDMLLTEVRSFLIGLFSCPSETVVQGYQNNSPLPQNAVVMSVLFETALDVAANYYDPVLDTTAVQQSVELTLQIDLYGPEASTRARKLANLWKNHYAAAALKSCQPLYAADPKQMTFVNEQAQYEPRWMVELLLQYNPEFEHDQMYLGMPETTLVKP